MDYFPSKIAIGNQFCNRNNEKALLKENIEKTRHTILIAPRRYGKSSLVMNTIQAIDYPVASVDLFLAHDDHAITKRILAGIAQAVSQLLPLNQKILLKLQGLFNKFRVTLGAFGFNLDITQSPLGFDAVDQVFSALSALEQLVQEQNRSVVFFIDEFQDIREAESAKSIQGAIRHIAQMTRHITFIFSGSHRRLLLDIFDDASKPLYMLCERMTIERIASVHYLKHLQNFAQNRWKTHIEQWVFEKIMSITELHPYYVNLLCHELWQHDRPPTSEQVLDAWEKCYTCHQDRLISDLEKLTSKQQDVLKTLALQPTTEPTGHAFISASNTPASSINLTMRTLLDKDMIYKITRLDECLPHIELNQWRVLDPLLAYALRKYA